MSPFADDYAWQLRYQPDVRRILMGAFGIEDRDIQFTSRDSEDDRRRNTDIWIMLDEHPRRVSQRLRRYIIGDEFTVRYQRPGAATEWGKLWDGFGDFLLYGRGGSAGLVEDWFVGSIEVLREWVLDHLARGEDPPHALKTNKDGSSSLIAFSRSALPPSFTVAEDPDTELREVWWAIIKDSKGLKATGHASVVQWARAGLGLDDRGRARRDDEPELETGFNGGLHDRPELWAISKTRAW